MNTENNTRRNSFSSFVKNLILLVSPSSPANDDLSLERTATSESSPFQDMYFSFPAFEETYEDSNCAHPSFISQSSIVC